MATGELELWINYTGFLHATGACIMYILSSCNMGADSGRLGIYCIPVYIELYMLVTSCDKLMV